MWLEEEPVWMMNHFGRIVLPELIDSCSGHTVITARMYAQHGRFLGGMEFSHLLGRYTDRSDGDCTHFSGPEFIEVDGKAYELDYRGGLIIP